MIINMNGAKAPETPSPVYQEKTVTPETLPTVIGADEGYDGLSQVTVNPDADLKPENIKYGKTVFGVEGSYGRQFTSGSINVEGGAGVTSDKLFTFNVDFSENPRQLTFEYPADIPQGMLLDPTTVKCNRPDFLIAARVPEHLIWMGIRGTAPWHMFNTQRGHKPDSFPYVITPAKEYRTMEDPINGTKIVNTFTLTYDQEVVNAPDNLTPENIKAGVTIAGIEGTYGPQPSEVTLETVVTTPVSFPTVVTPSAGYDGLSRVTVQSPDNLTAENIKSGVSIAGVTGTYVGSQVQVENKLMNVSCNTYTPNKFMISMAYNEWPTYRKDIHMRPDGSDDPITTYWYPAMYFCTSIQFDHLELPAGEIYRTPSGLAGQGTIKLSSYMFYGATIKGQIISDPNEVYDVGEYCFNKAKLDAFPQMKYTSNTIPSYCYEEVTMNSDTAEIPEGVTKLSSYALDYLKPGVGVNNVPTLNVILPSTITDMNSSRVITKYNRSDYLIVTCKPTTPPTLSSSGFGSYSGYPPDKIIVPSGCLATYQAATNWSKFADIMEEATE